MEKMNILAAVSATAMIAMATTAGAATFTYTYDGDQLPLATGDFQKFYGGEGTTESVSGGILTTSSDVSTRAQEYRTPDGANGIWNPTGLGSTIEARVKVDSLAGTDWAGSMLIATGSRAWAIGIGPRYISDFLTGGSYNKGVVDYDFVTLRFTIADEVNGPITLYLNNNPIPVMTWAGVASGSDRVAFGDLNNNDGGQIQWDYLAWTNAGAFAPEPVPEPASLSMLGLGMLALAGRRRRA